MGTPARSWKTPWAGVWPGDMAYDTTHNQMCQVNVGGDNGIYSSPALYHGALYFGGGDDLIHAVGESSGTLVWSFPTKQIVSSSPSEANGVIYVGSVDKNIYALDPTTGAKLWSYSTGAAPVWSSAAISHGVVYIADGAGYLYAFTPGGK